MEKGRISAAIIYIKYSLRID